MACSGELCLHACNISSDSDKRIASRRPGISMRPGLPGMLAAWKIGLDSKCCKQFLELHALTSYFHSQATLTTSQIHSQATLKLSIHPLQGCLDTPLADIVYTWNCALVCTQPTMKTCNNSMAHAIYSMQYANQRIKTARAGKVGFRHTQCAARGWLDSRFSIIDNAHPNSTARGKVCFSYLLSLTTCMPT